MNQVKEKSELANNIIDLLFKNKAFEENPFSEQSLAEEFGVSRTPIREALNQLEKQNLIKRKQKKGLYLIKPMLKQITEIYDLRAVMEGYAVRVAVDHATEEDYQELERLAEEFRISLKNGDHNQYKALHIQFHNKIIELADNSILSTIIEDFNIIRQTFELAHQITTTYVKVNSKYPHTLIIEKMREGNADEAEKIMRLHVQTGKQHLLESVLNLKMNLFYA